MVEKKKIPVNSIEPFLYNRNSFHMVGIIPISYFSEDQYDLPWEGYMMPIGKNFLAIERAVLECCFVGCKSIWIIANDDASPLLKYRLGEWVNFPKITKKMIDVIGKEELKVNSIKGNFKRIPIYYIPLASKDVEERDCLLWTILYGATVATTIFRRVSNWAKPDKFYISFPYGVFNVKELFYSKKYLNSRDTIFFEYNGKTALNDEFLPFTINHKELQRYKRIFNRFENGESLEEKNEYVYVKKKLQRKIKISDIVGKQLYEDVIKIKINEYYDISNWDGYCDYLASNCRKNMLITDKGIISRNNKIQIVRKWRNIELKEYDELEEEKETPL